VLIEKEWAASALQVSIGMIEILADHDEKFFVKHSTNTILSVVHTLLSVETYDQYIDLVKYSTTWMHARSLKQVLPERPSWMVSDGVPLLFVGSIRKFLRRKILSLNRKSQHLFWSFAQSKRCALVVPESFIGKSLVKHRNTMEKKATACGVAFLDSMRRKFENIVSRTPVDGPGEYRSICPKVGRRNLFRPAKKEILPGLPLRSCDAVHEYSTSACWEAPTNDGGAKGYLLYRSVVDGHTSNDELLKMDYHPRKGVMERRGFQTSTLPQLLGDNDDNFDQLCQAKVYPVVEPLKIRNITKSNAWRYALAKGLQKDIHTYMKQFQQFALIGEPLRKDHIEWLTKQSPDGVFASGDFSAATDNIKIELTKLFFEIVIEQYLAGSKLKKADQDKLANVFRRVLYEHEIHYPKCDGGELPSVIQQNGQLMGSVLSFPVLCAINVAAYWHAVEPNCRDFTKLKVMVNGDDILFRTTPELYQNWLSVIPEAGLFPSPGKNFFHKSYCTVNSQLFHVEENNNVT
jgi:hypothetical protein